MERGDVLSIMRSMLWLHAKIDRILELIGEDGEEEEDEADA
jgi:hypothetical protein